MSFCSWVKITLEFVSANNQVLLQAVPKEDSMVPGVLIHSQVRKKKQRKELRCQVEVSARS